MATNFVMSPPKIKVVFQLANLTVSQSVRIGNVDVTKLTCNHCETSRMFLILDFGNLQDCKTTQVFPMWPKCAIAY